MKLTTKDKDFLEQLRYLLDEKQLSIELKKEGLNRFILRQNYGDRVEACFLMSRQGVRWRFNHVFNEVYVQSLMAVLMIESAFGTELRHHAITIAKEQIALWQKVKKSAEFSLPRRQEPSKTPQRTDPELTRDSPS